MESWHIRTKSRNRRTLPTEKYKDVLRIMIKPRKSKIITAAQEDVAENVIPLELTDEVKRNSSGGWE
jgi:hypothetical protein